MFYSKRSLHQQMITSKGPIIDKKWVVPIITCSWSIKRVVRFPKIATQSLMSWTSLLAPAHTLLEIPQPMFFNYCFAMILRRKLFQFTFMLWLVNVFFSNTALQIHGHNKILICHSEIFWFAILKFSLQNKQTDYLYSK